MKQYKKPTREQKELLVNNGFEPKEWRFVNIENGVYEFLNPETRETIFLEWR